MSLATFTLRNKTIIVVVVMLLMLWGMGSYLTMPRREDPEYIVRTAVVSTSWPAAPVERVEELITSKLEDETTTHRDAADSTDTNSDRETNSNSPADPPLGNVPVSGSGPKRG